MQPISSFSRRSSTATIGLWAPRLELHVVGQSSPGPAGLGQAAPRRRSSGPALDNLPPEILSLIAHYVCDQTVNVTRRSGTSTSNSDLTDGNARKHWTVTGFDLRHLSINRTLYPIFFAQLWHHTAFILSLSSTDSLIFLKFALTDNQRRSLRRIRLTRFMLSWEDGVGDDIWLSDMKKEPAFHAQLTWKVPHVPRVNNLVTHLSFRHPQVLMTC